MQIAERLRTGLFTVGCVTVFAVVVALCGCGGGDSPPLPGATEYYVQDLGTLGGQSSDALGTNEAGQVVGRSDTSGSVIYRAFLWDPGTEQITDLGTFGGSHSEANAINDDGLVVGRAMVSGEEIEPGYSWGRAFLYDGAMNHVGPNPDLTTSEAKDINNDGAILISSGGAYINDGTVHELVSSEGCWLIPEGINDSGQVVGWCHQVENEPTCVAWGAWLFEPLPGALQDLPNLGGWSKAFDVNNDGEIVGWAAHTQSVDAPQRAFLSDGSAMYDLGTLGGEGSCAWAINDHRQIVGISDTQGDCRRRAFVHDGVLMWDLSERLTPDSDDLVPYVAYDVNNLGQIVGSGYTSDMQWHAFLATPEEQ